MVHDPQHKRHIASLQSNSDWQLQALEGLIGDLESLYPSAAGTLDIRRELGILEQWRDYYHQDRITIQEFCESCMPLLGVLLRHIRFTADQHAASGGQHTPDAKLTGIIRRIEKIRGENFT